MRTRYWYLVVLPAALFALGAICNQAVIHANHGHMPVLWPGGCGFYPIEDGDHLHICMNASSRLKFLGDWLMDSAGVSSPGDWLMDIAPVFLKPFLILWCFLFYEEHTKR